MSNHIHLTSNADSSFPPVFTDAINASAKSPNKKTPHLIKRANTYYFRMWIPSDLKHAFSHREIKRSLRTGNLKAARILASAYESDTQRLFASLRVATVSREVMRDISLLVQALQGALVSAGASLHACDSLSGQSSSHTLCLKEEAKGLTLREAVEQYKAEKQQSWTPRTRLEFNNILEQMIRILGGSRMLTEITRQDCLKCREMLLKSPAGR